MGIPLWASPVRTEANFSAADPWNQNRRTTFSIEAFVMVLRGTNAAPGTKSLSGYRYGIRSELDGQARMLPESLSELWRQSRIPAEALPALLAELQPKLKAWDYRPLLSNRVAQILQYVLGILLVTISFLPIVVAKSTGELEIRQAVVTVPFFLAFSTLAMYMVFFRKIARRKRQMNWALEQVKSGRFASTAVATTAGCSIEDRAAPPADSHTQRDLERRLMLTTAEARLGKEVRVDIPGGQESVTVKIPAGVSDGARLRLKGMGMPGWNGEPRGDLYLLVVVK